MQVLRSYGTKVHAVERIEEKKISKWAIHPNAIAKCGYIGMEREVFDSGEVTCKKCLKKIEKENKDENTR